MKPIRLGRVLSAKLITGHSINHVNKPYIGTVKFKEGIERVYLKKLPERKIAVEVLCSLFGKELGLEIPEPVICEFEGDYAFGCVDAGHPDLKHFINQHDKTVIKRLLNWPNVLNAGCFDEWIANDDRHGGNILHDGHKKFMLIDHDRAIKPSLSPNDSLKNIIMGIISTSDSTEPLKQKRLNKARIILQDYTNANSKNIDNSLIPVDDIYQHIGKLCDLLTLRLSYIDGLVVIKINPSQNGLFSGNVQ